MSSGNFRALGKSPMQIQSNRAFDPNTFNLEELIIIEAKPKNPSISLGTANRIPPPGTVIQMHNDWVKQTADKLKDTRDPLKIKLGDLIIKAKNDGKMSKALVAVDKQTGEIIVQKLN
jgi:hypothetical protein